MRRLLDLFGRRSKAAPAVFDAPLAPDEPLAVIGDVHGRDDLLGRLLDRLAATEPGRRIILVGDYIDRGEQSAAVLARLAARPDLVCLKGNHEAMCLGFLADPERQGPRWLVNGGLQTLASYGVGGVTPSARGEALEAARDRLAAAMGEELTDWLRLRPLVWRSGNVAVVHAAADPTLPLEQQSERTLIWGHPRFAEGVRADGIWIAHGHTITPEPLAESGRIAVDTGAYATGRLTAALVDPGGVSFVTA
ncbi:metallophosphoesterase [Rubellimicrobium arenae]|uniref:metallophosphoesterase n=1 Tax=Rubellimicrobium arenae TaxID=2817372 RepID=UPI001B303121|nr:metallophosphoesterase [Rubellimicrobium arenae]